MKLFRTAPFILFFIVHWMVLPGQELPHFSQYQEYQSLINPGSINHDYIQSKGVYKLAIGLSHRHEGIEGFTSVPVTQVLQVEWVESNNKNSGAKLILGGQLINDQFGPTGQTGIFGRLGVLLPGSHKKNEFLSAGLTFGSIEFRQSTKGLIFADSDNRPAVGFSQRFLNLGLGLFYQIEVNRNPLYFGVSMPQIRNLDLLTQSFLENGRLRYDLTNLQQYYITLGGYYYPTDHKYWHTRLWLQIRNTDGFRADLNCRYQFEQPFWIGTGLGLGLGSLTSGWQEPNSLHFEFGLILNRPKGGSYALQDIRRHMRLGFGYDYYLSSDDLPVPFAQALEINLRLLLPPRGN